MTDTMKYSVFLQCVHHAYAQTDGTYAWPNSREGDLLRQAKREIDSLRELEEELVEAARIMHNVIQQWRVTGKQPRLGYITDAHNKLGAALSSTVSDEAAPLPADRADPAVRWRSGSEYYVEFGKRRELWGRKVPDMNRDDLILFIGFLDELVTIGPRVNRPGGTGVRKP